MTVSLFKVRVGSTYANLDAIKISRAVISSYIKLFGSMQIIEDAMSGRFAVTDPLLLKDGKAHIESSVIPLDLSNLAPQERNRMMGEKKKRRYINVEDHSRLNDAIVKSGFSSLDIHSVPSALESLSGSDIRGNDMEYDFRPGIDIKGTNFFIKELRGAISDEFSIYVRYGDEKTVAALIEAGDVGMSARRSTGAGVLKFERVRDFQDEWWRGEGIYLSLSPFIPSKSDIQAIDFLKSYYRTSLFSGRSSSGKPYNIFRYVRSGSLLYLRQRVGGTAEIDGEQLFPFKGFFL